jgi:FkbM family methyltransferase
MDIVGLAKMLVNLLPPSAEKGWIIDGGCHAGVFTSRALQEFPLANILAFEPDPDSWAVAQKNVGAHERVEVVQAALGAERGRAEFFRGPYAATNSLLPRPTEESRPYYPQQASLEGGTMVDVVTLDEECGHRGIQSIEVLKLDLQGGELAALQGAKVLLEAGAAKVVVVEAVFIKKYQDQPLLWKLWREMEERGYTLYSLEAVKLGLYHAEPASLRHRQWNQCDAIFISKSIRNALDK